LEMKEKKKKITIIQRPYRSRAVPLRARARPERARVPRAPPLHRRTRRRLCCSDRTQPASFPTSSPSISARPHPISSSSDPRRRLDPHVRVEDELATQPPTADRRCHPPEAATSLASAQPRPEPASSSSSSPTM
jgi:hypothetical protein